MPVSSHTQIPNTSAAEFELHATPYFRRFFIALRFFDGEGSLPFWDFNHGVLTKGSQIVTIISRDRFYLYPATLGWALATRPVRFRRSTHCRLWVGPPGSKMTIDTFALLFAGAVALLWVIQLVLDYRKGDRQG